MTETKAINLCLKHRDPVGFEFLVQRYQRQAYFHGLSFMGNSQDATEACQEAFMKAFVAITQLEKLDHFYPWFYRILKNHCLNLLKKKKAVLVEDPELISSQQKKSLDHFLFGTEDKKALWQILQSLKTEFRQILVMKHIEELSYDEISKTLNIPRGTVMSRLYHARLAFKEKYLSAHGGSNV